MEIIQERLEREYDLDLVTTSPTVVHEVVKTDGEVLQIDNPDDLPKMNSVKEIREPIVAATLLTPHEFVGNVIQLFAKQEEEYRNESNISEGRLLWIMSFPLQKWFWIFLIT